MQLTLEYIDSIKKYINKYESDLQLIFTDSWKGVSEKSEIHRLKEFLTKENVGVSYINKELEKIQSRYFTIKLSSVFCHGSPKVDFVHNNKQFNRELADLLVIYRINDGHYSRNIITSRSFLSQWKLNKNDNKNIGQQYLYDYVNTFNVPKWLNNSNNGQKRCFAEKENALNFFYLDQNIFLKRPNENVEISFSSLMIDLLKLEYGLQFDNQIWNFNSTDTFDRWDEIMYDLIGGVGKKIISGTKNRKLSHYLLSNESFSFEIEGPSDSEENIVQSILIVDVHFNLLIKYKRILKWLDLNEN
jgi:hypothetical protein